MLADTLERIEKAFSVGAAGQPSPELFQTIFSQLAQDFAQLRMDLGAATGWATPTGTLDRTAFNTGTVTLGPLAQRVGALITDLESKGVIGP